METDFDRKLMIEHEVAQLADQLAKYKIGELHKEIQTLEQNHWKETEQMEETNKSLQEKIDNLETDKEQSRWMQKHQQQLEDRIEQLEAEVDQLTKQNSVERHQAEKKYVEACRQRARLSETVRTTEAECTHLGKICGQQAKDLASARLKIQDLEDELVHVRDTHRRQAGNTSAPGISQGRRSSTSSQQSDQQMEILEVTNIPGADLMVERVEIPKEVLSTVNPQKDLPLLEFLYDLKSAVSMNRSVHQQQPMTETDPVHNPHSCRKRLDFVATSDLGQIYVGM